MSHILAPKNTTFENLTPLLRRRAGLPDDAEVEIYEEIKYEPAVMCQRQRMQDNLNNAQLEHGDILCVQETVQPVRSLWLTGEQAQRPSHAANPDNDVRGRTLRTMLGRGACM